MLTKLQQKFSSKSVTREKELTSMGSLAVNITLSESASS